MANIESKNLLVAVKAFARGNALPLDKDEVWDSLESAQTYAASPTAYAGQTIKVLVGDEYKAYILQPTEGGLVLKESSSEQVAHVQVVNELPSEGMAQGIIYIVDGTGYIWTGSEWQKIFKDMSVEIEALESGKADLDGATFTGKVYLPNDVPTEDLEAVTKGYVDGLINNLVSSAPGVVDSGSPLPDEYKAGQTWRVAEVGTYAGQVCEVGDLIICINDGATGAAEDFIVVQANVNGAVTGPASVTADANIVVFDGITGKIIKDSQVSLESLNDAISKKHWHENKDVLDSYTKTQDTLVAELEAEIGTKASADSVYTKTDIDGKVSALQESINGKVSGAEVDAKINTAVTDFITADDVNTAIADKVGEIPVDTTVKDYIDTAVGSGGTASAEAIAKAKQEAIDTSKAYADTLLTIQTF